MNFILLKKKALAQGIGANTVTPTGNVGGSAGATTLTSCQIPSHGHNLTATQISNVVYRSSMCTMSGGNLGMCGGGGLRTSQAVTAANTGGGQSHSHNLSANFTGSANSVLQPGLVLNYIIKT